MAIKVMTWKPDICNCILKLEYDDQKGMDIDAVVLPDSQLCSFHFGKTRANILASALGDHSRRKNHLLSDILSRFPAILGKTNENGDLVFKEDNTVAWSFSGISDSRVLNISFNGVTLTNAQKTTLRNAADARFGAGKIVIS